MTDKQCSSCGGFCGRGGCKRENVKPKEWQGLTDEDMDECIKTADYNQAQYKRTPYWSHLAAAIEAKLKEKNGFRQ